MKTESNNNINDSLKSIKNSNSDNNIINFCDSIIANVNESQQSISKINENNIEKEKSPEIININEDKDSISDKENIISSDNKKINDSYLKLIESNKNIKPANRRRNSAIDKNFLKSNQFLIFILLIIFIN